MSREDFEDGTRGLLKKAMCGARDAAQNWELKRTEMMTEAGFQAGIAQPVRLLPRAEERQGGGVRTRFHGAWAGQKFGF